MAQPGSSVGGTQKIRIMVVDDSAVIRKLYTKIIESDPALELVAAVPDPYVARDRLVALKPDVILLDIEMPRMDGISFLQKVMEHLPTRTIVISSLSARGSEMALRAFEAGAIEVMEKPSIDVQNNLMKIGSNLIAKIKMVARAQLRPVTGPRREYSAEAKAQAKGSIGRTTHQVLAIASSTGGTEALKEVLTRLPANIPGTLIVQHMPPVFTKSYAASLNKICPFTVKEAEPGDKVVPGQVLIAPGNFHMEIDRSGAFYFVKLHQEPTLHGVRPAADYLMNSVAQIAGKNAIGVVLTGMGRDGAQGLLKMREAGSYNIAQDQASCVVFGMPKEAVEIGAIHAVKPLTEIAGEILKHLDLRANTAA